jgi:hypothetical protein
VPIVAMRTRFRQVSGSQIFTTDIDFPPQDTFVTAALSGTTGGGTQFAGIARARTRPTPEGPEVPESFGSWFEWRSALFRERMSSVTCGIATGTDQTAQAIFSVFFWD